MEEPHVNGNSLPNFSITALPEIYIKSIRLQNFKAFEDYTFDFTDSGQGKRFVCLIGPNGTGKSTLLNSLQMLFSRFEGWDQSRLNAMLGRSVRHTEEQNKSEDDFLLTAELGGDIGGYQVQITKNGFVKDHPDNIKEILYRLCYSSRFDMELGQFQLIRERWPLFKELFESVTGFTVEEKITLFDQSDDPMQAEMLEKYVVGFTVHKPYEIISHRECSDGERKVIKSFSTLLNMEYTPRIIIIDNIEMHVEQKRHFLLIESLIKSFPNSQIFSTTHSYYVARSLGRRSYIYDMRMIHAAEVVQQQPWRLQVMDEIDDALVRLQTLEAGRQRERMESEGKKILTLCSCDINDLQKFEERVSLFLQEVYSVFLKGVISSANR